MLKKNLSYFKFLYNKLDRLILYYKLKLARLPASNYAIASGFACGAMVSFTPLLGLHFLLNQLNGEVENSFTLFWAEWVGLLFIAIYFIAESIHRDKREVAAGIY